MKALFTRKTVIIAAVAVLIAIITFVSVNVFGVGGPVTGLANVVSRPLKTWASSIARSFESIYGSIYRYEDLKVKYEAALEKIAKLEDTSREAAHLEEELIYLRALHNFGERNSGHVYELAQIISPSSSNWSSSFTINVGYANSTIVRGNGVVTESGMLVGQVSEVGATTSVVVSILDTTFKAGASIGDGGGSATAMGEFTLMRSGLLMLDFIDDDLIILPGDSVITAGKSGVFPVGLVVGEVVEVLRHDTGVGRYATVKPMRELRNIKHVIVITDFDIMD